jgi:hypothetical protein
MTQGKQVIGALPSAIATSAPTHEVLHPRVLCVGAESRTHSLSSP